MQPTSPTSPTTVPQPLPGLVDPQIDLASIADPWEQRVTAISLVAGLRASQQPPRQLFLALPPVEGVAPFQYDLPSPDDFRRDHLPGRQVLAPHQVESWIGEQSLRDGGIVDPRYMGVWMHRDAIESEESDGVVVKAGTKLYYDPEPGTSGEEVRGQLSLEYLTPWGGSRPHGIPGGGVLYTLRRLSCFYSNPRLPWRWTEAQGTMFVLTGLVPYAAQFATAVAIQHGRRPRAMSVKHLTLGVFSARHSGEGLAERLAHWNTLHSEWVYKNADQFSSDSARALRRLGG